MAARTHDGRVFRLLTMLDEYSRECLAIDVARKLNSEDVLERLTDLFILRGVPAYIRSDNGSEFTAQAVRKWLSGVGVKTLFIEPGSPWENGYLESFNGKLRDELLNVEIFDTLLEAKVLIERWRAEYNQVRPHSSLGYRPPAPEAVEPLPLGSATLRLSATAGHGILT
jgi:transposase InsO family protein